MEEFVKKEHPEELFFSGSGSNIGKTNLHYMEVISICNKPQGCPSMNDIPNTMDYDGKKRFLCAVVYDGFGGEYPINSCNGELTIHIFTYSKKYFQGTLILTLMDITVMQEQEISGLWGPY